MSGDPKNKPKGLEREGSADFMIQGNDKTIFVRAPTLRAAPLS